MNMEKAYVFNIPFITDSKSFDGEIDNLNSRFFNEVWFFLKIKTSLLRVPFFSFLRQRHPNKGPNFLFFVAPRNKTKGSVLEVGQTHL